MASSSQPQPSTTHTWTAPRHYLNCQLCREYRALQARVAQGQANRTGRLWALGAGQPYRYRTLSISPRLRDPRLRSIYAQEHQLGEVPRKHVTIQVPCLGNPVRPNQTIGLSPPGLSPLPASGLLQQALVRQASLHQSTPSKKRPATCTSTPDPAQHYVPDQYPEGLQGSDHQASALANDEPA